MIQVKINNYGRDKLKNLASYSGQRWYPVVHEWQKETSTDPKKYTLYYAVPDNKGNTFTIPYKWCEDVQVVPDPADILIELNEMAIEQLSKVGSFSNAYTYPVIKIWYDDAVLAPDKATQPETGIPKRRFDIWFAILDKDRKIFIVQSTWGRLILLDSSREIMYPLDTK